MNHSSRQMSIKRRAWRGQVGVVALAAVMVAGCSSSTDSTAVHATSSSSPATSTPTSVAPAAPAAAHGVEAAIGTIPWSQVGAGWMLATWSPAPSLSPGQTPPPGAPTYATATTTLYLVDPAGGRYPITTFAPPGDKASPELVDWSGDGSRALFYAEYSTPPTAISVDLHSGAQTTIPVNGSPRYTRPDGKALLLSSSYNGNNPGTLKRVDLTGKLQLTYPTDQLGGAGRFGGDYLESPDGTQLVLGTASALVVMGNDGKVGRELPSPMPGAQCSPVRWWTSTMILANCTTQLWEVPVDGAASTPLTAVNPGNESDPGFGKDLGDTDAWQLPGGTFLQSMGACGSMFLSRLTPDMHTTEVTVPGVDSSVRVAGATADMLVLQAKLGCGSGVSLLTYNPAANTTTALLGPPVNGGGVADALLYPSLR